jgi:hypothetical protein
MKSRIKQLTLQILLIAVVSFAVAEHVQNQDHGIIQAEKWVNEGAVPAKKKLDAIFPIGSSVDVFRFAMLDAGFTDRSDFDHAQNTRPDLVTTRGFTFDKHFFLWKSLYIGVGYDEQRRITGTNVIVGSDL